MTDAISEPISGQPASDTVRKAQLAQAVQQEVVAGGRVEAQGDYDAVIRYRRQIHPVQRLVLALVTFGLWAISARIMYRSHQFIEQMTPLPRSPNVTSVKIHVVSACPARAGAEGCR
jgi:hypothetical protein